MSNPRIDELINYLAALPADLILPTPKDREVFLFPELVITHHMPPSTLIRAVIVLPFDQRDWVTLASSHKRNRLEIPGGKVERHESVSAAAHRELKEETGCEVYRLVPVGFIRLCANQYGGSPKFFHQYFAGRINRRSPYVPNEECGLPVAMSPLEVLNEATPFAPQDRLVVRAAMEKFAQMDHPIQRAQTVAETIGLRSGAQQQTVFRR